MNCRPLSLCKCSGSPYWANTSRNSSTDLSEEVDPVNSIPGHLLCASTMIRNIIMPHEGPSISCMYALPWLATPMDDVAPWEPQTGILDIYLSVILCLGIFQATRRSSELAP